MSKKNKKMLIRIIISVVFFVGIFLSEKLFEYPNKNILPIMYLVPYFIAGYDVIAGFLKNIVKGKIFDEEFLMTIATLGAFIIGEYPESVFVMVFFQIGELFQSVAVGKSRKSITELMDICPEQAVVIRDGKEETVFPEDVKIGDTLIVRAGEKIPVDGIILFGESTLNMSALTGESAPIDVFAGSEVKAGSINITGTIKIKACKEYYESTAAKILELVENSSLNKAKSERFLTRFAKYYTPCVVIGAVILAVVPSLITGNATQWIYRALIFLVVSCPCALVISVPLSFFAGIGSASSKGMLVKGANYLEMLGKTKIAVFDKTGTLTTGEFSVSEVYPADGYSKEDVLILGASAEYYSYHPIAKSIVKASGIKNPPISTKEHSGFGVEAKTERGTVLAGNRRFLEKNGIKVNYTDEKGTNVLVALNNKYIGCIKLSDTLRSNSKKALASLKKAGVRRIVMLTGDNEQAAGDVAGEMGISEFKAGLLPDDKAKIVENLCKEKNKNDVLIFVGDGINDAPVLALSDVGVAMGGIGSDAAIEAADIVIMNDDLEKCATGIKIAKKTNRIVRQNVIFALGVKFAVLILTCFGISNMWIGVFADVGVAVLAILNAIRALKIKE